MNDIIKYDELSAKTEVKFIIKNVNIFDIGIFVFQFKKVPAIIAYFIIIRKIPQIY